MKKQKMSSSKKILISSILIGVILIGAIISIVIVFAAQRQNVTSSVTVNYIVDGVAADVTAKYAVVPTDETVSVSKTAMGSGIQFDVDDEKTFGELNQGGEIELESKKRQIVYEYKFTNLAEAAFTITLTETPATVKNMTVGYKVSATEISASDYKSTNFDLTQVMPQAIVEKDRSVYIYISVKVTTLSEEAKYDGDIVWVLNHKDPSKLRTITLNDGINQVEQKIIQDVQMPLVYNIPTSYDGIFTGYFNESGTKYINADGTSAHTADITDNAMLTAQYSAVAATPELLNIVGDTVMGLSESSTNATEIAIPDGVTTINASAFANNTNLTSVTIPNSVQSIGANAFDGNTNLEEVNFTETTTTAYADNSSSLTTIEYGAFSNCSSLSRITIPESVTSIGSNAFSGCSNLTSITIPNSIISIGNYAFSSCDNLTYNLYDDAKYLGNDENPYVVLMGLTSDSITSFEVKKETRIISDDVFSYTIIESITFEEDSQLKSVGSGAFFGCPITEIFLPEGLLRLGDYVFYETYNLNVISLPSTLNYVGEDTFGYVGDGSVEKLYIKNIEQLFELQINTGDNYYGAESIYVDNVLLREVIIPSTVTKITSGALHNCKSITSVIFSDSVTEIGYGVFENCTNLTSVTFSEESKLTSIGKYAFYNCSSLSSITIPNSVTSIAYSAFYGCYNLKYNEYKDIKYLGNQQNPYMVLMDVNDDTQSSYEIHENTKIIYDNAFSGCSGLTSVTFEAGSKLTSIGDSAFDGCSGLTSITIPSSVTIIGNSAFQNCSSLSRVDTPSLEVWLNITFKDSYSNPLRNGGSLYINNIEQTEIEIPNTITKINSYAFLGCSGLTNVIIPSSVTSIGDSAFDGCSNLTSITIPSSVTSIGDSAFYGCSNLTSITIPSSITSIGNFTFYNCSGLTSITIPSSVTSIGGSAFNGCSGLTSITIPSSVTIIGNLAFYGCSGLTSITIPSSVTSIGSYAFYGCTALTEINYNATKLTSALSSSNNIFYNAGKNGTGITVNIGESVEEIPAYLFYMSSSSYRPKITSVVLPSGSTWVYSTTKGATSGTAVNVTASTLATNLKYNWRTYYLIRTDN